MASVEEVRRKAQDWDRRRRRTKRVNYTERARQRIDAGYHPLRFPAPLKDQPANADPEHGYTYRCGNCAMLMPTGLANKVVFKCELKDTNSEATDVRKWWPACPQWQPVAAPQRNR